MRKLDQWFFVRVERLCHGFQRWTGKTHFWLAKLACLPVASTMALYPLDFWFDILPNKDTGALWALFGSGAVVAMLVLMEGLRRLEEPEAFISGALPFWLSLFTFGKGGHPMRGAMTAVSLCTEMLNAALHLAVLRGSIARPKSHTESPLELLISLGLLCLALLMYALEVRPLPPGTSKFAELKRALTARLVPARVPVP